MNTNVIRTLTLRAKTEGVPESTADLNKLKTAHEGLAKVTDTSAKGQLSLADAVSKAERRLNSGLRAQQDFEKVQRQMNMAVAQNPALQERVNAVMALARVHFDNAGKGAHAHAAAMQAVSAQAQMLAGRMGPLGSVLTTLGPAGLVAAAGIGAMVIGIHQAVSAANALADKAGKMVDFAETTGLTTTQLQALQKAAAFVGLDAEKVGQGFEKFTVQLEELRRGTGGLYDGLNRINPALTTQLARTRDAGEAWDVFAKAVATANREQGVALSRAAFGRGGAGFTRLAGATNEAGGMGGLVAGNEANAIAAEQLKKWDDLKDKIDFTTRIAKQNVAAIFTEDVLRAQLSFAEGFLRFSQAARDFKLSGDWNKFVEDTKDASVLTRLAAIFENPMIFIEIEKAKKAAAEARSRVWSSGSFDEGGFGDLGRRAAPSPFGANFNFETGGGGSPADVKTTPAFDLVKLQEKIAAMGEAASSADKLAAAEAQLAVASKKAELSTTQFSAALDVLRLSSEQQQLQARVGLLGVMASVEDKVAVAANTVALARARGVQITDDESRAVINLTRNLAEAATAEGRMKDARGDLFKSQVEQDIDKVLLRNGIPPESERAKVIADYMRMTDVLHQVSDLSTQAVSGFFKDVANGVDPLKAAADQAKRLAESIIDITTKRLIGNALGSLFGDTAGMTVGAASAAGILTTAGATLAAAMIAGATTAAGILGITVPAAAATLPIAGAVTGVEIAAGGVAGGIGLAVGGTAAATAIYGPIAILVAAIAALGALSMFDGGGDHKAFIETMDRKNALFTRRLAAVENENDINTTLQIFDHNANLQRIEEARKGNAAIGDLELTLSMERLRIINDLGKAAAEAEKHNQEEIAKRRLSAQDRLFGAANDNASLAGQLAAFDRAAMREREVEIAAGGQAIADLEAALAAERLNVVKSFNDEIIEETKRTAQEQIDAINGTAKSVVDYLASLIGGSGSTLSPVTTLSNALQLYNANLGPAQGGNLDAQQKFPQLADALEKAARAVYASGQGYQDIRNLIISQGLALPAVQQTTDPVVIAIRDSIIAIQDTTAAVSTMRVALQTAITSANPQNIASALSTYFNNIDTNVSGLIDFNEMKSALGGMASDSALRNMFTRLDVDASGNLTQAELIATRAGSIASSAGLTQAATDVAVTRATESTALLEAIKGLQGTANSTLAVLRDAFVAGSQDFPALADPPGSSNSSDTVIIALRKIVYNTGVIAFNTINSRPGSTFTGRAGTFATGGVIPPFGLGLVSEHLNPTWVRAGAEPITVSPGSPNWGRGANDNSALIAKVERLTNEVVRLQAIVSGSAARGAQATVETGERIVEATDRQTEKIETVERQKIRARARA